MAGQPREECRRAGAVVPFVSILFEPQRPQYTHASASHQDLERFRRCGRGTFHAVSALCVKLLHDTIDDACTCQPITYLYEAINRRTQIRAPRPLSRPDIFKTQQTCIPTMPRPKVTPGCFSGVQTQARRDPVHGCRGAAGCPPRCLVGRPAWWWSPLSVGLIYRGVNLCT